MPPASRVEALDAAYRAQLIGSARARYEEKMRMCNSVDPYTLWPGLDTVTDVAEFPEVTHGDIVNYLVYSSSFVTCLTFVLVNFVAIWNGCNVVAMARVRRLRGRHLGYVARSFPLYAAFSIVPNDRYNELWCHSQAQATAPSQGVPRPKSWLAVDVAGLPVTKWAPQTGV
ncbi:hypothetical protein HPB48_005449 [Haemaphysalis longicornis]|uniref:Uncharacterized protein n=1 Tax=Haemaphysalis longicornis TaxID=44386 RepID=A0A9J6GPC9_HAELO|nr:hypothetical protein HPB48_005449 [Haemaphysalis longicornis]